MYCPRQCLFSGLPQKKTDIGNVEPAEGISVIRGGDISGMEEMIQCEQTKPWEIKVYVNNIIYS